MLLHVVGFLLCALNVACCAGGEDMASNRHAFFRMCLVNIAAALSQSFETMHTVAKQIKPRMDMYKLDAPTTMLFNNSNIDKYAEGFMPKDAPANFLPLRTTANGNCLYNAVSISLCGHEAMSDELRLRTLLFILDIYDNLHIEIWKTKAMGHMKDYIQFSGHFHILQPSPLTFQNLLAYVKSEASDTVTDGRWSGRFQIQALSSAISIPMMSIYPDSNRNIRHLFNTLVQPWFHTSSASYIIPVLWSGYTNANGWFQPNHFVPLVDKSRVLSPSAAICAGHSSKDSSSSDNLPYAQPAKRLKVTETKYLANYSVPTIHRISLSDNHVTKKQKKLQQLSAHILTEFQCLGKLPNRYCEGCGRLILAQATSGKNQPLCSVCKRFKTKGQQSPLRISAMYPGDVPEQLQCLNGTELHMVTKIHPYMSLLKLPVGGQFSQKGQSINFPVPVQTICEQLSARSPSCKVLLYSAKTNEHPSIVNVQSILSALAWLKTNNCLYKGQNVINTSDMTADALAHIQDYGENYNDATVQDVSLIPVDYIVPRVAEDGISQAYRLPVMPGEPINIFQHPGVESCAFPHLFPYGTNTFKDMDSSVTIHQYIMCRFLNEDARYRRDIQYLFWSLNRYEQLTLQSSISVALRLRTQHAVKELHAKDILSNTYSCIAEDFQFMRNMRGTAAYWKNELLDLMAKMQLLGPPTFFLSLSSNDSNWKELYRYLKPELSMEEMLSSSEKSKILRSDPIMSAIYFSKKWELFLKQVNLGASQPLGQVTDHFARVEFQNRGSPHIHAFFWIEGAPNMETESGRKQAGEFIDKYISAQLPPENDDLFHVVNTLQIHSHTHTCTKTCRPTVCRFDFPREICDITTVQVTNISSTTGRFYKLKRDAASMWVNTYNRDILRQWNANMDIQIVGCKIAAAIYICTYICKDEPKSLKAFLAETVRKLPDDASLRKRLSKKGNILLTHRLISAQESAFRLLSLPLVYSSRGTIYINAQPQQQRHRILKPKKVLQQLPVDSTDIFSQSIHDIYARRPFQPEFETMCLAEFATTYKLLQRGEKNHAKSTQLVFHSQYIRQRKRQVAFRTYLPSIAKDPEHYYYTFLCLFPAMEK